MNPPRDLTDVITAARVLLLDFDGPICGIFTGLTDRTVADRLRLMLPDVPEAVATTSDPLEVLRQVARQADHTLIAQIENELRRSELEAVHTAEPTPFAAEAIISTHESGRPVVIVSNNSAEAIEAYLKAHQLDRHVSAVIGRPHARPDLMKPRPDSILLALRTVDTPPAYAVLLGDSASDIEAAAAAGAMSIGYANRDHKREAMIDAGADALIEGPDGMAEVANVYAQLKR